MFRQIVTAPSQVPSATAEEILDHAIESIQMDDIDLETAFAMSLTIDRLNALVNSVETQGLTPALLSFVDHDRSLSRMASQIPTLEAYTQDQIFDQEAALETLKDMVKTALLRWITNMAAACKKAEYFVRLALGLANRTEEGAKAKLAHITSEDKADPEVLHKIAEKANARMAAKFSSTGATENFDNFSTNFEVFKRDDSPHFMGSVAMKNIGLVKKVLMEQFELIAKIETNLERLKGGTNEATVTRRQEIEQSLNVRRRFVRYLLNVLSANRKAVNQLAGAVSH